jgi:hypothetical protein
MSTLATNGNKTLYNMPMLNKFLSYSEKKANKDEKGLRFDKRLGIFLLSLFKVLLEQVRIYEIS